MSAAAIATQGREGTTEGLDFLVWGQNWTEYGYSVAFPDEWPSEETLRHLMHAVWAQLADAEESLEHLQRMIEKRYQATGEEATGSPVTLGHLGTVVLLAGDLQHIAGEIIARTRNLDRMTRDELRELVRT